MEMLLNKFTAQNVFFIFDLFSYSFLWFYVISAGILSGMIIRETWIALQILETMKSLKELSKKIIVFKIKSLKNFVKAFFALAQKYFSGLWTRTENTGYLELSDKDTNQQNETENEKLNKPNDDPNLWNVEDVISRYPITPYVRNLKAESINRTQLSDERAEDDPEDFEQRLKSVSGKYWSKMPRRIGSTNIYSSGRVFYDQIPKNKN